MLFALSNGVVIPHLQLNSTSSAAVLSVPIGVFGCGV